MFHTMSPMAERYQKEKQDRATIFRLTGCPSKYLSNHDRRLADEVPADCIYSLLNFFLSCNDHAQETQARQLICLGLNRVSNKTLSDIDHEAFSHCDEQL